MLCVKYAMMCSVVLCIKYTMLCCLVMCCVRVVLCSAVFSSHEPCRVVSPFPHVFDSQVDVSGCLSSQVRPADKGPVAYLLL